MADGNRKFENIRGRREVGTAQPVDEFMAELETLQSEIRTTKNHLWEAVADGSLNLEWVKRLCKEYHALGRYYTTEFGTLSSLAPL
ncbi:MAG: hypothetical protein M1134_06445, partial [Actinobacteria bacterium]|nr:hypothetical protein [Actinomycetota bacterium]